jgi:protease-4
MDPEYAALPEGYAAYRTYFKSFLDRFNITINLFKVGQYKSAAEPYIQDAMSEEDKEARLAYLMAWWKTYTDRVEQARDLSPGQVDQSIVDVEAVLTAANGHLAQVALDTGLVDRLLTEWERDEYLISVIGEDPKDDTQFAGKLSHCQPRRARRGRT